MHTSISLLQKKKRKHQGKLPSLFPPSIRLKTKRKVWETIMFVDSFLFFLFKGQEDAKSKQLERQPVVKDLNQLANHLSLLPIYISPWLNIHPEKMMDGVQNHFIVVNRWTQHSKELVLPITLKRKSPWPFSIMIAYLFRTHNKVHRTTQSLPYTSGEC